MMFFPDEVLKSPTLNQRLGDPQNYSTIPLSLFFFIGLIYMIKKIKDRNLNFSEFVLLVLFTSLFIFMTLFVDRFTIERYYLPIMFPVMLIASYGLWNFIQQIQTQKGKILFFHGIHNCPFIIPSSPPKRNLLFNSKMGRSQIYFLTIFTK